MAKRRAIWLLSAVTLSLVAACGDDESPSGGGGGRGGSVGRGGSAGSVGRAGSAGSAGSAGRGGSAGSVGSAGTAGSAGGAGTAGSVGSAGSAGSSGGGAGDASVDVSDASGGTSGADAGVDGDATTEASTDADGAADSDAGGPSPVNPRGITVVRSSAEGGATASRLLAAGTNFVSATEVATVALPSGTVTGRSAFADGDAVPAASGGLGFVLERTNDKLHLLTDSGAVLRTVDMRASGSGSPDSAIFTKGYVLLYNTNFVAVVDLDAGSVSHRIDLGRFHDAADTDGAVDMEGAVFVESQRRLYLVLGRIDRNTIGPPSFKLACPAAKSLLVAIDVDTDQLVDLDTSGTGLGIELELTSPSDVELDSAQNRLLVLNSGCFAPAEGGQQHLRHGVEIIALATGTKSVPYQASNEDFLSRLLLVASDRALIQRFDVNFATHWNNWTIGSSTLGTELSGVPSAPSYDGAGNLLGISITTSDAGSTSAVVRYALSDGTRSTISSSLWNTSFGSSGGTALVR